MVTTDEILEAIGEMNVMQVQELVKGLEDKFGITAAAPVAVAAAAPAGGDAGAADAGAEEKTDFEVTLTEIGDNKINVIKAVREVTALGLREAKELVEAAPTRVKEGANKEEADTIKSKLEEAGASVEIA
ncbi:MAG: 50S ribosomal protein L7/L12 [Candidatus Marinimicrobia bacterium]|nr:50S ribosomal protein L7/L12 [Candidatus Neomarinimicrobiota bacterium]|tara:strand:- start:9979 stop:10368 length:390 start_codon:yes stop_codon:yes gene_type:complete